MLKFIYAIAYILQSFKYIYTIEISTRRSYAAVVRGCMILEDDCKHTERYSSVDSGFEGLENIEPLDLVDIKRYHPKRW